jgi:hypothetical protein
MEEPYMLACHIDHPLARRGSISLSDVDGENFVLRTSCEARRATQDIKRARYPDQGHRAHRAGRPRVKSCGSGNRRRIDAGLVHWQRCSAGAHLRPAHHPDFGCSQEAQIEEIGRIDFSIPERKGHSLSLTATKLAALYSRRLRAKIGAPNGRR